MTNNKKKLRMQSFFAYIRKIFPAAFFRFIYIFANFSDEFHWEVIFCRCSSAVVLLNSINEHLPNIVPMFRLISFIFVLYL